MTGIHNHALHSYVSVQYLQLEKLAHSLDWMVCYEGYTDSTYRFTAHPIGAKAVDISRLKAAMVSQIAIKANMAIYMPNGILDEWRTVNGFDYLITLECRSMIKEKDTKVILELDGSGL